MDDLLPSNDCVRWLYDWYVDGGRIHDRAVGIYENKEICIVIPRGLVYATVFYKEGNNRADASLIHVSKVRAWIENHMLGRLFAKEKK